MLNLLYRNFYTDSKNVIFITNKNFGQELFFKFYKQSNMGRKKSLLISAFIAKNKYFFSFLSPPPFKNKNSDNMELTIENHMNLRFIEGYFQAPGNTERK